MSAADARKNTLKYIFSMTQATCPTRENRVNATQNREESLVFKVKPPEMLYGAIIAQVSTQCLKFENPQTTLAEALRQIGDGTVFLWAFRENRRARRFYEKHGFRWDGTERISEFDGATEVRYVRK